MVPYTTAAAIADALHHIEKQIKYKLELEQVWLEGDDILLLSICSNWEIPKSVRYALPKLQEILGETEGPKWYLDVEHSTWTSCPIDRF